MKKSKSLISASLSTFTISLISSSIVAADENPFSLKDLGEGYQLAGAAKLETGAEEGKCGEGKCGEGKCGENMSNTAATPQTDAEKESSEKSMEGKCGEGKCGAEMMDKGSMEGGCGSNMRMDEGGMVMNENLDQLPEDCPAISKEVSFTVRAGTKYAKPFMGTTFGFDQHEFEVPGCARITVTFINEDHVRHQWMVHNLPKYLYPQGMYHMEVNGPGERTGTFIVPSAAKTYLVHCDLAGHMEKGMKGQLVVNGGDGDLPSIPGVSEYRYPDKY